MSAEAIRIAPLTLIFRPPDLHNHPNVLLWTHERHALRRFRNDGNDESYLDANDEFHHVEQQCVSAG
jgi:hypothetical protein